MINWIKEKLGFEDGGYICACGFKCDCEDELNSHECFYTMKSIDIMNSIKKSRTTLEEEITNNAREAWVLKANGIDPCYNKKHSEKLTKLRFGIKGVEG